MNKILTLFLLIFSPLVSQAQDSDTRFCHVQHSQLQAVQPQDQATLAALKQQEKNIYEQLIPQDSSPKIYCGQDFRLSASALNDLEQHLQTQLGADWQLERQAAKEGIATTAWQSKSQFWPKKYYHLLYQAADNNQLIMRSFYIESRNSALHQYVVFGVAASPFILMLALIIWVYRRKRRKTTA